MTLATVLNRNEWGIASDLITATISIYFCLRAIVFFDNGTPRRVGLKSYTNLCGRTIPWACFGDIQHMFSFNFRLIWGLVKIEGKFYDRSTTPECSWRQSNAKWYHAFGFTYLLSALVFVLGMGHWHCITHSVGVSLRTPCVALLATATHEIWSGRLFRS